MRAKGYEIKGETFGEDAAKYISFRPLDKERFVRGSTRSLGKEYTKERIRERIEKKRERKAVIPKKHYSARRIIDTSDEKFQNSPGLQQWAAIENLKIAAQSYNEAGSLSDLEHKITVKTEAGKSAKQSVVELEHRMKTLRKSSNMPSSTETAAPIISLTKKPRTRTLISANTKARSSYMAVQDGCLNRQASS